jgi:hypothetical protein
MRTRFIVRDCAGQALAYVYYEEEPGRRSAAKPLRKDEADAVNIAKLPALLRKNSLEVGEAAGSCRSQSSDK